MKPRKHTHPRPWLNRAVQYGALVVVALMVASAPLQVLLTLAGAPDGFVLAALLTVLLAAPVLMLTAYTPAVSVDDDGITLHPVIWRDRFVAWDAIQAVKVYPLLPTPDMEAVRRIAVGRRKYRPAEGIMLVVPGLPPQYRIAGFFAGERAAPIVVLTNRAHTDYGRLLETVLDRTAPDIHGESLYTSGEE